MVTGSTGSPFPKWQLAILLGAPVALGLGYLYLRNSTAKGSNRDKKKLVELTEKSISLDDDNVVEGTKNAETPVQRSQRYKNKGNTFFKSGKYDDAIKMYRKAIEECPDDCSSDMATYYQNCAAAYEQLKRWSMVKSDCTKALELNPRYIKALHRRARAYETTNELEECLEDITAVCIMEGFQNQSSLVMADRVLKQLGRAHAREALENREPVMPSNHFIKTYFSSFSEDPIKRTIINRSEGDALSGYARAKQAIDEQNYDEVISACTEEIDSSESEAQYKMEALVLRATFYLLTGRHDEAMNDIKTVIDNEEAPVKVRVNALIKRGSLHMQQENQEQCMADFEKASQLDPTNSDVYHHRGQVQLLMENINQATSDFHKAVELNPDFEIAYVQKIYTDYRYAFSVKDVDKLKAVMAAFEDAIKKFPRCPECYTLYAQVLCDQQQFNKADTYFQKAIDVDPNNATVHVHRGLLRLQWNGDITSAVEMIGNAIQIDPKCEFGYETLGTIEVQRGNLENAISLFAKALNLAKTELEMAHLFSLKDAATAQMKVSKKYNIGLQGPSALL